MNTTRRSVLMGGPAAGAFAVPLAAVPNTSAVEEPLLEMEKEWFAWRDHCCTYPDESDAARDPLFDRLNDMEVQIHRTPATTPAGIAVKLRMWARSHGSCRSGDWWERSVEDFGHDLDVVPIIGALRDAERLAREGYRNTRFSGRMFY